MLFDKLTIFDWRSCVYNGLLMWLTYLMSTTSGCGLGVGEGESTGFFVYYILTFITPPTFLTQSIKFHFVCTVTSGRQILSPQLYINVFTVTAAVLSLFFTMTEKCQVESTVVSDAEIQQYPLIKSSHSINGKATPLGQVMMEWRRGGGS